MSGARSIYLDTGFAIALLSPRDQYHSAATQLAARLRASPAHIVTSDAVIFEIGAALAKPADRVYVDTLTTRIAAAERGDFASEVDVNRFFADHGE